MKDISSRHPMRYGIKTVYNPEENTIIKYYDNKGRLEKTYHAMTLLYKRGFPLNKVLDVDWENLVLYLEYIPGVPLGKVMNNIDRDKLARIFETAAELLYRIHHASYKEIQEPFYSYFRKIYSKYLSEIKDPRAYRFAKQILETNNWDSRILPLVHADYTPNNWIIDEKSFEIVGIVDWEGAMYFDPFYDLAVFEGLVKDYNLRKTFVMKYLSLANEDYRVYHELKIVYQVFRVLEGGGQYIDKYFETMIDMIERDRNINIAVLK